MAERFDKFDRYCGTLPVSRPDMCGQVTRGRVTGLTATEDDVLNCYRIILCRAPENEAVVALHLSRGLSVWEMIEAFVRSEERKDLVMRSTSGITFKLGQKDYLANSLNSRDRLIGYFAHFTYLCENIDSSELENVLLRDIPVYSTMTAHAVTYKILLSVSHWHQFEGEMTLAFRANDTNLYLLSFTIVPGCIVGLADKHTILISRLQGSYGKFPELRQATKELREIHPRAALFAALQGIAQAAGFDHIAGVCGSNQVTYSPSKAEWFEQAYDKFFTSVGASRCNDQFYIAKSQTPERPLPSGKYAHKLRATKKLGLKAEILNSALAVFRGILKGRDKSSANGGREEGEPRSEGSPNSQNSGAPVEASDSLDSRV
jgi:uncharacterized protein VirK/YbjX